HAVGRRLRRLQARQTGRPRREARGGAGQTAGDGFGRGRRRGAAVPPRLPRAAPAVRRGPRALRLRRAARPGRGGVQGDREEDARARVRPPEAPLTDAPPDRGSAAGRPPLPPPPPPPPS